MSDPFYKRSGFGTLIVFVGTMLIYWAVDEKIPTSDDWVQVLLMSVALLGYQVMRQTTRVP